MLLRVIFGLAVCWRTAAATESIIAGYAPGISGMVSIDPTGCRNDELRQHEFLANPLECARTCRPGESKTCYYKFVIERYPVNGQACNLCMPNITNTLCPNCQCVPGDGTQRTALTVNRMMPGPSIQVCAGDYVVVDVLNNLKSELVTIHWHGLFQQGSQHYDGVPHVTQCPILSNNEFRYQFFANNGGTHFWHAHTALQKMDGIFGSFIVREPEIQEPYSHLYDFDLANHVMIVNDWFTEESANRFPGHRAGKIRHTAERLLINGKAKYTDSAGDTTDVPHEVITVDAEQRYRFRFINSFCTVCPGQLTIEGHNLTVIATDGQPIKPVTVDSIVSLSGERYDFVISTDRTPGAYWIQLRGLDECASRGVQQLAILQYVGASTVPKTAEPTFDSPLLFDTVLDLAADECFAFDSDKVCIARINHALPVDPAITRKEPDVKLDFTIGMLNYAQEEIFRPNTYNNFLVPSPNFTVIQMLNNISGASPSVPPLSQLEDIPKEQFCNADNLPKDCHSDVCTCVHLVEIPLGSVVEINLIDEFNAAHVRHPFHLHGFAFHVMDMGQPFGPVSENSVKMTKRRFEQLAKNDRLRGNVDSPLGKDTIAVPNNGYVTLRFRADNPGYWLFHCHQIFHPLAGMEVVLQVGKVTDMPKTPQDFPKCGNYKPKIEYHVGNSLSRII